MKEIKGFRTYWDEFRKIAYPVTHINAVIGYNGETLAENLKIINKAIESLSAITPEEFNKIKDDIKNAVDDLEKFKKDLDAKEEEYKQLTEQAHTELNNAINSAKNALEQALKDADSIHEEIKQAVKDVNTAITNLGNVATKEDIENALQPIESTLRDLGDQCDNAVELVTDERQDRIQAIKDLQEHCDGVINDYASDIQKQVNELDKSLDNYATKNELDVVETLAESVNQGLGDAIGRLDEDEEKIDNLESSLAEKPNISDLSNVIAEEIVDEDTFEEYSQVTREELKKDLFIDLWNNACNTCGKYNEETGYFELNGLTDITYEEALNIYNKSIKFIQYLSPSSTLLNDLYRQDNSILYERTYLPIYTRRHEVTLSSDNNMFRGNKRVEVINIMGGYVGGSIHLSTGNTEYFCKGCINLKRLLFGTNGGQIKNMYLVGCDSLEWIDVANSGFWANPTKFGFPDSPKFDITCLKTAIEKYSRSPFNIVVHQEVYDKITNSDNTELYNIAQTAAEHGISFITA